MNASERVERWLDVKTSERDVTMRRSEEGPGPATDWLKPVLAG